MKIVMLLVKIILTFALIYFAVRNINFSHSIAMLNSRLGLFIVSACVLFVVIQSILAGYRTKLLLTLFNYSITAYQGISSLFMGNFFSQTMLSFIGGDAVRILELKNMGIKSDAAVKAILLDRVLGFVGLQLLLILTLPFALRITNTDALRGSLIFLVLISIAMILGFVVSGMLTFPKTTNKWLEKLIDLGSVSRYVLRSKSFCSGIIIFSTFLHVVNVLAIYFCANMLGAELSLLNAIIIGSPVMLVSLLPISIGGWGIRENSMILGLGLVNISADIALTISIVIGAANVFASIPGALMYLFKAKSADLLETA